MRIFLISLLVYPLQLFATTYYVANSGNDSNPGTNSGAPWKTLAHTSGNVSPGDSVLLNRGDVWNESLPISVSGTSGSRITYSAYGSGDKPLITNRTLVTGWSPHATYGWRASYSGSSVSGLFVGDERQHRARWPNSGVNELTANPPDCKQLTSNSITQPSGYWTGARVFIESANWYMQEKPITSHVGNTIYWGSDTSPWCNQTGGSDFYIEGKLQELDNDGEWYQGGGYIYFMYPTDPDNSTITVNTQTDAVAISSGGNDYITINNLAIKYWGLGIEVTSNSHGWVIDNCELDHFQEEAIKTQGDVGPITISDNTVNDAFGHAVNTRGGVNVDNITISGNTITNTAGDEIYNMRWGNAIQIRANNSSIENNVIDGSGWCGIWIDVSADNLSITDNEIKNYQRSMDDGGAIYIAYGGTNNLIARNYIHDAAGINRNTQVGVYPDQNATGYTVENNILVDAGDYSILCNRCRDNIFRYNTSIVTSKTKYLGVSLRLRNTFTTGGNNEVYGNVFYNARDPRIIDSVNPTTSVYTVSYLDYNLYHSTVTQSPICMHRSGYPCTYYSVQGVRSSFNFENNGLQTDSVIDFVNDNFGISAGFPELDAGRAAAYPSVDYDGTSRYIGSGPDIGACEGDGGSTFCGDGGAPPPPPPDLAQPINVLLEYLGDITE